MLKEEERAQRITAKLTKRENYEKQIKWKKGESSERKTEISEHRKSDIDERKERTLKKRSKREENGTRKKKQVKSLK